MTSRFHSIGFSSVKRLFELVSVTRGPRVGFHSIGFSSVKRLGFQRQQPRREDAKFPFNWFLFSEETFGDLESATIFELYEVSIQLVSLQ